MGLRGENGSSRGGHRQGVKLAATATVAVVGHGAMGGRRRSRMAGPRPPPPSRPFGPFSCLVCFGVGRVHDSPLLPLSVCGCSVLPLVLQVLRVAGEQQQQQQGSCAALSLHCCLRIRKPSLQMLAFLCQVRAGEGGGRQGEGRGGGSLCLCWLT